MSPLPAPEPDAARHSEALRTHILDEIAAAGGWLSFARFMELALYAPGQGYYSAGLRKFGTAGDFVTAPEISPLFGRALARQAAQVLQLSGGDLLEAGAGSGRLAADLLPELERLGRLPAQYLILEVSADLRERQRALLAEKIPYLADRVRWLDELPSRFRGLVLGNEVLDAMPVHIVAWREDGIYERGVAAGDGGFSWSERKLTDGELLRAAAGLNLPAGYVSEINLASRAFVATLAGILEQGAILMLDYGFGASEYYHPQRSEGTLMCHYRQHAHGDPFFLPGLQDITAHVDFSAIAVAGIENGLTLMGYTTQAHFLINCGITEILAQTPPSDTGAYLPLAAQAQKLLSPAEMGELFKAIALGRGITEPLIGFRMGDRSRML
ncbi:MAG: SAM-dependent methyltransferase [Pseudomonadota bacterium]